MNFFDLTFLIVAAGVTPLLAQSTNDAVITPTFINELADQALTNNAALRAADKLIEAARQNEASVRTWEDPTVRIGRMAAEKSMRRDDGDLFYGVEQKLPLFGKPVAARRVAEAETAVEQVSADLKFQLLRKEIAIAVFKTALAERNGAIVEQDLGFLDTLSGVSEERYASRTAGQIEVLRIQNERSKRRQQLRTDGVTVTNSRVQLNRLIGRNLQHPLPALALPDVARELVYSKRLVEMALKAEPNLKKLQREGGRAGAIAEQTRRQRYPDFTVGVEARNYTGSGEVREGTAFVAFNFPWGNRRKYDADFEREKARQEAIELEAADYELEIQNEIYRLLSGANNARTEALTYREEIIPRAQIAIESTRAAWENNAGSLTDLLEGRRMLLDAQLMYARAVAEQYELLSELVLCCGLGDLEALEMFATGQQPQSQTQLSPKQ